MRSVPDGWELLAARSDGDAFLYFTGGALHLLRRAEAFAPLTAKEEEAALRVGDSGPSVTVPAPPGQRFGDDIERVAGRAVFSRQGGKVALVANNGEEWALYVYDVDTGAGGHVMNVVAGARLERSTPTFSLDGQRIFVPWGSALLVWDLQQDRAYSVGTTPSGDGCSFTIWMPALAGDEPNGTPPPPLPAPVSLPGMVTRIDTRFGSRAFPTTPLAVDEDGAIYTHASSQGIVRIDAAGRIETVVPSSDLPVYPHEGHDTVGGIAVSGATIYYSDPVNHTVVRVVPGATGEVIAGNGSFGFAGDGGPATAAQLDAPGALAIGPGGVVYVADWGNSRIRSVSPDGTITTLAGDGGRGESRSDRPSLSRSASAASSS